MKACICNNFIITQYSTECMYQFNSVQSLSCVQSLWPHGLQHVRHPCRPPTPRACSNSCPLSHSNHLILWRPLQSFPASVFPNESVLCIRWPKNWSFSFTISPSNEYSGLISFRIDWLDLLAIQGTLRSLLQYHSSKASILRCSKGTQPSLWSNAHIHTCSCCSVT